MIATTQQNVSTDLDLGSLGGPPRNWKGIGIAMVVILAVLSLVTLSIMLLTPDETHLLHQSHLTVEDLESDKFQTHDPCVTWLNEDEVVLCSREGHVIKHDLHTNQTATLLDNSTFDLKAAKFQVSADQRFVLLAYNIRQVFSQSFTASYAIYSVATGDIVELATPGKDASVLQFAAWGPQGNQLIYVFENDIYYRTDVSSNTLRLTYTGREGLVVSGLTDWVYEEEVLLTYQAHWWSEDGARLAYLTINNSATPFMEIPHFLGEVYPSPLFYAYPKAGANIPAVSLHVVNLYGPAHTLEMVPPDSFSSRSHYISMVTWISSTQLAVRWVNRPQNQSALSVCEATTGACSEKHKLPVDIWQDQLQEVPLFSKDASTFYLTLPAKQGARGEFRHVASLQAQPPVPSAPPRFLTSGNWDVSSLCALDEQSGKMYKAPHYAVVVAMYWGLALAYYRPAAPLQMSGYAELINQYFLSSEMSRQSRHLYSVDLSGVLQRQCLTCNLIENCSFLKAQFSPNRTRFTLHCLGPGIPKVTVHSTKEPHRYIVLEDNKPMSQAMEGKWLPEMQFRTLSGENYDLHLKLSLPQTHEENVHPLLIIVDGTPGSYTVTEEFSLGWPQVLSSTHGVVVAWIDNRSSATRGQKSTTHDARKLSSLMVKDQLGVVEWLMQLPFIDNRRMALYGKAFGGYMALKMLAATDQLFKCAAVMAPVTDFRFYSAAFSERYFGLPSKDESAYVAASVLEDAERLKHENFLILHGTSDARVHFQHSAELLSRLVRVEANYTLQLYPDEGHSLRAERSQQHFRRTLGHFLQVCLIQAPPRRESAANQEDDY